MNKLRATPRKKFDTDKIMEQAENWAEKKEANPYIKMSMQLKESTHLKFKSYCVANKLTMQDTFENIVKEFLKKND